MYLNDSRAGVLAHSQTSKGNNSGAELSLENKGHGILHITVYLIFLIYTYRYTHGIISAVLVAYTDADLVCCI